MENGTMTNKRANGEGTVFFIEREQKWRAEITWFDNGGNKHRKCWKSQKQSEVKAKLAEFKKQLLLKGTYCFCQLFIRGKADIPFLTYFYIKCIYKIWIL